MGNNHHMDTYLLPSYISKKPRVQYTCPQGNTPQLCLTLVSCAYWKQKMGKKSALLLKMEACYFFQKKDELTINWLRIGFRQGLLNHEV